MAFGTHLTYLWILPLIGALSTKVNARTELDEQIFLYAKKTMGLMATHDNETNFVFSPFAIQRQMILAMHAARGSTYNEIRKSLYLQEANDTEIAETFATINSTVEFTCIDHLYYRQNVELQTPFRVILKNMFNVSGEAMGFEDSVQNVERINQIFSTESEAAVNDYLDAGDIKPTSDAYFLNAAYLKKPWAIPFQKRSTRLRTFYNWGHEKTSVETIYGVQEVGFATYQKIQARAIELCFKDSYEKLFILLPNERNGLLTLQKKLRSQNLRLLLRKLKTKTVAISIPHFSLEYRADAAELTQQLSADQTITSKPDFSNGFETTSDSNIPSILHKAAFGVNEFGSLVYSPGPNDEVSKYEENDSPDNFFLAQHPFIFIVHSDAVIHFAGRVLSLKKEDTLSTTEAGKKQTSEDSTSDRATESSVEFSESTKDLGVLYTEKETSSTFENTISNETPLETATQFNDDIATVSPTLSTVVFTETFNQIESTSSKDGINFSQQPDDEKIDEEKPLLASTQTYNQNDESASNSPTQNSIESSSPKDDSTENTNLNNETPSNTSNENNDQLGPNASESATLSSVDLTSNPNNLDSSSTNDGIENTQSPEETQLITSTPTYDQYSESFSNSPTLDENSGLSSSESGSSIAQLFEVTASVNAPTQPNEQPGNSVSDNPALSSLESTGPVNSVDSISTNDGENYTQTFGTEVTPTYDQYGDSTSNNPTLSPLELTDHLDENLDSSSSKDGSSTVQSTDVTPSSSEATQTNEQPDYNASENPTSNLLGSTDNLLELSTSGNEILNSETPPITSPQTNNEQSSDAFEKPTSSSAGLPEHQLELQSSEKHTTSIEEESPANVTVSQTKDLSSLDNPLSTESTSTTQQYKASTKPKENEEKMDDSNEMSKSSPSSMYNMLFSSKKKTDCKTFKCLFKLRA